MKAKIISKSILEEAEALKSAVVYHGSIFMKARRSGRTMAYNLAFNTVDIDIQPVKQLGMSKQITRQQAEEILNNRFLKKYVTFTYPGYKPVVGRVDRICLGDAKQAGLVLIFIGDKKYNCSPEMLKDCLTLLNSDNGNTSAAGDQSPAGSPEND